jgi:serine/threonine protein phosphatase PrpC
MGQVFLARSPGGRPVAIKVVRPELAREADFRRRFAREVAAARRVNGAFTAGVVDADPDGSPAWLATVYVPGVSLGEAVAGHGPWPAPTVLALGAGLAEALEAIHDAGVVHRDLKPSNILLAADGPRVIDFGISITSEASALTGAGVTIGTAGFMSPEQLTGAPVGPASDVFALGAVLAYTATSAGPFGTGSAHALHYRTVHEHPDLRTLPPELRDVVAACLAKQPGRRPALADLLRYFAVDTSGGHRAAQSTHLLKEPGWMPAPAARLVREHATLTHPSTTPPLTPNNRVTPPPAGFHQAPTRTGKRPGLRSFFRGKASPPTPHVPTGLTLHFAAGSHRGLIQESNGDSGYAGPRLLAIADGTHGQAAGQAAGGVASSEVISTIVLLDDGVPGSDILTSLGTAVQRANDHLRLMIEEDPQLEGMSTTLTALLWTGQRFGLAHVGNSRAYLLRDGVLTQITQDHTWARHLVDEERITEQEAIAHPQRSLLMRALGSDDHIEPDLSIREVRAGDRYLVCSDGLSSIVSHQTIGNTLATVMDSQETVRELIQLSLRGGGPDNTTVIVADVLDIDSGDSLAAQHSDVPIIVGAVAEAAEHEAGLDY